MQSGIVNGSDLLLFVGGKALGSCSTHSTTFNTETKDRAIKPVATLSATSGLWKSTGVTGLSVEISGEGLVAYDETENGFKVLLGLWKEGKPVEVKCIQRGNDDKPYLSGSFIINSIQQSAPAQDDATYTISLKNNGEVKISNDVLLNATTTSK